MTQEQIKALKPGARVKLSAYGGEVLERRVVKVVAIDHDRRSIPVITTDEVWQQHGEDSEGIGWPPEDVLEEVAP
jgi:hypothetical protein